MTRVRSIIRRRFARESLKSNALLRIFPKGYAEICYSTLADGGCMIAWPRPPLPETLGFARRVPRDFFFVNNGLLLTGAVAYNAMLSLVPLAALLAVFFSRFFEEKLLMGAISTEVSLISPKATPMVVEGLESFLKSRQLVGLIGIGVLLFTTFYKVMPVMKISFRLALSGGATAAVMWEILRTGLVSCFTHLSMVNAIYGSMATTIILLLTMEAAAPIVLLGAQVIADLQRNILAGVPWYNYLGDTEKPVIYRSEN
jgi:uncharacterized BrkB/YihY/UPF0761 family membrane protein